MDKEKRKNWWQFVLQVLSALVAALSAHTMLFLGSLLGV